MRNVFSGLQRLAQQASTRTGESMRKFAKRAFLAVTKVNIEEAYIVAAISKKLDLYLGKQLSKTRDVRDTAFVSIKDEQFQHIIRDALVESAVDSIEVSQLLEDGKYDAIRQAVFQSLQPEWTTQSNARQNSYSFRLRGLDERRKDYRVTTDLARSLVETLKSIPSKISTLLPKTSPELTPEAIDARNIAILQGLKVDFYDRLKSHLLAGSVDTIATNVPREELLSMLDQTCSLMLDKNGWGIPKGFNLLLDDVDLDNNHPRSYIHLVRDSYSDKLIDYVIDRLMHEGWSLIGSPELSYTSGKEPYNTSIIFRIPPRKKINPSSLTTTQQAR